MDWRVANDEGQQSLESVLARRDSSTRLLTQLMAEAQQRKAQQEQMALATKREAADESIRRDTLASNDAYRQGLVADKERNDKLAEETRFQKKITLLPKGTIIGANDKADFDKFGMGALLKHHGADAHSPAEHDEFTGTESAVEAGARNDEATRWHDLTTQIQQATSEGRISAEQARLELARMRLEFDQSKPPKAGPVVKTPEQIGAEAEARAAGAAKGRQEAQPPGLFQTIHDYVLGPSTPAAAPSSPTSVAPAKGVRMSTPDGRVILVPADKVAEATQRGAKPVQ